MVTAQDSGFEHCQPFGCLPVGKKPLQQGKELTSFLMLNVLEEKIFQCDFLEYV